MHLAVPPRHRAAVSVLLLAILAAAGLAGPGPSAAGSAGMDEYEVNILGLERHLEIPPDNPMSDAKVALGRQLYFDPRLSGDGSVSCATCHDPDRGWADGAPVATGIDGRKGRRSAPTVINAAYNARQLWDGRAATLEEQVLVPIESPVEMGHSLDAMVRDLSRVKGYQRQFREVFGTGITLQGVARSIAAFERTLLSGNSPADRYEAGDEDALSESAKRGRAIFRSKKGNCSTCHAGSGFTDHLYHNLGIGMDAEKPDLGRYEVTGREEDRGAFKTPTLRDIALTAPYMHDGSERTLEDVIDLYVSGGRQNPHLDEEMKPLRLSGQDRKDLVEFLKALTGDARPDPTPPTLP